MELKIEHLAPYLPYNLKMNYGVHIAELLGIYGEYTIYLKYNDNRIKDQDINSYKPILHPISDLTKEIEVNGERFIPLIKIAELFIMGKNPTIISSTNGGCVVTYKHNGDEFLMLSQFVHEGTFVLKLISTGDIVRVDNFSIFQQLCKWHIDFQELIPEGLAIDINTLNKKNEIK